MQREQLIRDREDHLRNVTRYEQDIAGCRAAIEKLRQMVADIDDDVRLLDAVATVGVLRSDVDVLLWQIVAAASDAGVSQTDLHHETGIARSTLRRRLDAMAHDEYDETVGWVGPADAVPDSRSEDSGPAAELPPIEGADAPLERCTASYVDGTRRCRLLTADHEGRHDYLALPQPMLGGHSQQVAPVTTSSDHQFDPGPYLWDCSCGSGGVEPSKVLATRAMELHVVDGHRDGLNDQRCGWCGEPGATVDDEAGPLHAACQAEALSDAESFDPDDP